MYLDSLKQLCFPLNENIENILHFVASTVMHNNTRCEHILQDDKSIIIVTFINYFNVAIFLYIF